MLWLLAIPPLCLLACLAYREWRLWRGVDARDWL